MLVFEPAGTPRAALVLFHGGGLMHGAPEDLARHCEALAAEGILAASAGYRLVSGDAAHIGDCLDDVRSAMAEFRDVVVPGVSGVSGVSGTSDASGARVVPLAAGGSSAGGHLALLATLTGPNSGFDTLVLFNPVVDATIVAPRGSGPGARTRCYGEVDLAAAPGPARCSADGAVQRHRRHHRADRDSARLAGRPARGGHRLRADRVRGRRTLFPLRGPLLRTGARRDSGFPYALNGLVTAPSQVGTVRTLW